MSKKCQWIRYDKIFLIILFLVGLLATFAYGVYFDQSSEQQILFSNIKEYAIQFGAGDSRLVQDMDAAGVIEISESVEKDHGIAPYYPAGIVWYINQVSPYAGSVFWHMYTFVLVFLGMISLFYLSKSLFHSEKLASFVTLLFFLTPRMFAESHYNNKDMVLLSLVFILFYWGWRLINETTWKSVVLFAIAGAFAFNVKIIGAWFFGIIGIYVLLYFICNKRFNKVILGKVCVCIVIWALTFILITPACWNDIIGHIQYVIGFTVDFARWKSYILFNGQLIHEEITGMPQKYLPTLMLFTIPVGILCMVVVGGLFLLWDLVTNRFRNIWQREGYVGLILFAGMVPLAYAILASTSLYNGWRHFYFVYVSMIILAGYGIYRLYQVGQVRIKKSLLKGCAVVYVAVLAIPLIFNYSQANCYYNWLAGSHVENRYEMDYWNVSMWQGCKAVVADAKGAEQVSVSALNAATLYGVQENWNALPKEEQDKLLIVEQWESADYIIVNMTYAMMYNAEEYQYLQKEYELIRSITSYGNIVCEVYKAK